jgi:hypothetical protein
MAETSEVITVRVPKGTRALLKKAKVNVSEEVREYLEAKAKSIRLYALLPAIHKRASRIKISGDSTEIIRHYRDTR